MIDTGIIQRYLGSQGRWWDEKKAWFILENSPPGSTTEDVLNALDSAFRHFESRGERLRKPLAYVLTEDHQGRSMVSRQRSYREERENPEPDYARLRALNSNCRFEEEPTPLRRILEEALGPQLADLHERQRTLEHAP